MADQELSVRFSCLLLVAFVIFMIAALRISAKKSKKEKQARELKDILISYFGINRETPLPIETIMMITGSWIIGIIGSIPVEGVRLLIEIAEDAEEEQKFPPLIFPSYQDFDVVQGTIDRIYKWVLVHGIPKTDREDVIF